MGLLPTGLFRSRDARQRLPVYEQVGTPSAGKERYSDSETSSDDEDDSDSDGCYSPSVASPCTPSGRSSRHSSGSATTSTLMLPKRAVAAAASTLARLPRRRRRLTGLRSHLYRLPNKITRYLCAGMIATIIIFIVVLVRASQLENRRIASGNFEHPPPPPPVWESFDFLTRYYGGVRSLVHLKDDTPQYPGAEDELPYNVTTAADASNEAGADAKVHLHSAGGAAVNNNKGPMPPSVAFDQHPDAVLAGDGAVGAGGDAPPVTCFIDRDNKVHVPTVRYYDGRPAGFPRNVLGSYELLGLPEDVCFERYGRFAPYGYGYSVHSGGLGVGEYGEKAGSEDVWGTTKRIDYSNVDWAEVQKRCYGANAHRFQPTTAKAPAPTGFYVDDLRKRQEPELASVEASAALEAAAVPKVPAVAAAAPVAPVSSPAVPEAMPAPVSPPAPASPPPAAHPPSTAPRTAVVVRCWDEFVWREEDIMNLRALISELSLASGARYDVHLLVQVKNDGENPIWADEDTYRQRIVDTVPAEFRGLVTLWTETQMLALYQGIFDHFTRGPGLPVHGVYRGLQMAMQHFAQQHPEYAYFWQWEMDIRYTGHNLDLFTKMENWAREQPRKGLWERNARFYMPDVHGSWDDFRQMARVQSEVAAAGSDAVWPGVGGKGKGTGRPGVATPEPAGDKPVWGPVRAADPQDWFETDSDPMPPTTYEKDRYVWGVGEEPDLITMSPLFDPEGTTWLLADDITGYNETAAGGRKPPRRAQIITASRMSGRLLRTMHRETAFKKHHAFSEMWPATAALQHGYKAVYVPHPVYVDRAWPVEYMAHILNGGLNGASGGGRASVFGQREHNFQGVTWYYNAGFSPNLYRRWLGLRVNNDGGQAFEEQADPSKNDTSVRDMRGGEGRMCLPPMLLHPIKDVELPVESNVGDEYAAKPAGTDPSA